MHRTIGRFIRSAENAAATDAPSLGHLVFSSSLLLEDLQPGQSPGNVGVQTSVDESVLHGIVILCPNRGVEEREGTS